MSDWTAQELQDWDQKVCEVGRSLGLDWFPIVYDVCDYYEMLSAMTYHGLPSHYSHWSFGKSFEATHQRYNAGVSGLPYEMIINSNPSIAYLMKENPLHLQILIMAHCVGHSDFFKNNVHFKHTNPDSVVAVTRNSKKKIQSYIEDPSVGVEKVEKILDACHAIGFHTEMFGRPRVPHADLRRDMIERTKNDRDGRWDHVNALKIPIQDDYDVLGCLAEHGKHLEDWEREVIEIVRNENVYFMPQIRTKVLNEGFAVLLHYKIMNMLDLPQELYIPFMKSHNQVVRPFEGEINPYHLGWYIFKRIEEEKGFDECLFVREIFHDESAIREFIDEKACHDLGLFTYSLKKLRNGSYYTVDDVPDTEGWKDIRENLIRNVGVNRIPKIFVEEIEKNGTLILKHDHDGRDLQLDYAEQVVEQVKTLWQRPVKLFTVIEEEDFEI